MNLHNCHKLSGMFAENKYTSLIQVGKMTAAIWWGPFEAPSGLWPLGNEFTLSKKVNIESRYRSELAGYQSFVLPIWGPELFAGKYQKKEENRGKNTSLPHFIWQKSNIRLAVWDRPLNPIQILALIDQIFMHSKFMWNGMLWLISPGGRPGGAG